MKDMLFQDKIKRKLKKKGQRPTIFQKKNRKGVSEMIGYILLITIGIAMSILVFTWLKGYVPTESIECNEGVSIFIKEYTYDCNTKQLTLVLKNNGRFSLSGYLIHGTTQPEQELATKDLSEFYEGTNYVGNGEIRFAELSAENTFPPSSEQKEETRENIFILDGEGFETIYSVEIVPTRYETISEKKKLATCTKAKVEQEIEYTVQCE